MDPKDFEKLKKNGNDGSYNYFLNQRYPYNPNQGYSYIENQGDSYIENQGDPNAGTSEAEFTFNGAPVNTLTPISQVKQSNPCFKKCLKPCPKASVLCTGVSFFKVHR